MGVTVLFGGIDPYDNSLGDTWLFDGQRWRQVRGPAPSARRYAAFAYHPGLKGCVLHGGAYDDRGQMQYGDAWLFRQGSWSRLFRHTTAARDDHALAFHQAGGVLLMLGGLGQHPALLAMTDDGWRSLAVEAEPPNHQCSPLAYDVTLGGLVLHGGEARHGGPQFDTTFVLRGRAP